VDSKVEYLALSVT